MESLFVFDEHRAYVHRVLLPTLQTYKRVSLYIQYTCITVSDPSEHPKRLYKRLPLDGKPEKYLKL